MNWQQIMEEVVEINELQQILSIKLNSPIIMEIVNRLEKYCNNKNFDLKSLNNAILEHKIIITPYQMVILEKAMSLTPGLNLQSIYINMPTTEEEATKYIIELKNEYELANKSIDLVIDIETLSAIEYEINKDFKNTEYAKKVQNQTEFFEKEWIKFPSMPTEIWTNILMEKSKKYLSGLSIEAKKALLIETLTLSYDRNSFEFLNREITVTRIGMREKFSPQKASSLSYIYTKYQECMMQTEILILEKMSLEEIYQQFKLIYDTSFYKQKIIKK